MKKLFVIIFLFGCTETIIETEIVEVVKEAPETLALNQVLNTSYVDYLLFVEASGDTLYSFATRRPFDFDREAMPVSLVRGLIVYMDGEIVGKSMDGYVVNMETREQVIYLMTGGKYDYIVEWVNREPLPIRNVFFSNFYLIEGTEPDNLSRPQLSMVEAIKILNKEKS